MMSAAERERFLLARRGAIGSSDAAPILGLSPWKTKLHVYLDKTGQLPDEPGDAPKQWGNRLEDVVAQAYQEETGLAVVKPAHVTQISKELPHVGASIDRLGLGVCPVDDRVVECKTARDGRGWGEPGTDEVPEDYYLQVQHQLFVTGLSTADIPVLIAGSDFRIYTVQRSALIIRKMLGIYAEFWEMVQSRRHPPPDWFHPSTPQLLRSLYGVVPGQTIQLPPEVQGVAQSILGLKAARKRVEARIDECEAFLMHALGTAEFGALPGGYLVRRQKIKRKAYSVKETEYIAMRVKGPPSKELDDGSEHSPGGESDFLPPGLHLLGHGHSPAPAGHATAPDTGANHPANDDAGPEDAQAPGM